MYKLFFLLLFLLLYFSNIQAKEPKKELLERMIQPKVTIENSFINSASIQESSASLKVDKNSIRINNALASLSYTNWSFLWNNIASLPFGDGIHTPIKEIHALTLSTTFPIFINEKWFLLTSLSLKSSFEKEMKNSYGGGFFSFASYKLDDDHNIQMGAFANYHKVSTLTLPVMSYSYRARANDGLVVILGFPRAYIGYYVNDAILFRSGMIFSQSLVKLSSQSVIESFGYIEAKDYMSNAGLSYELSEHITLQADLLYSLKRNFIIYDRTGKEQESHSIKPSFGGNFRLTYLF